MYASYRWLHELCPFDAEPIEVAEALTARGLTVDGAKRVGDDTQLEIDVPANRPDCLGHRGLAREISAALDVPMNPAPPAPEESGPAVTESLSVEIEAPELCGRFTARIVRGVRIESSPDWISRRLEVCDVRSINNVVDASNLVMLETGNPIHFFDLPTIADQRIVVRRAAPGEVLKTLDGQDRELDRETIVVADGKRGIALGGVMGGTETEIGDETCDVLIEAAWFLPDSIRRTARRLGLHTDASHRFERGADRDGVLVAQAMAARLLVDFAGGSCDSGMIDVHPDPPRSVSLTLRTSELSRLLGYTPDESAAVTALQALGLDPRCADGSITVTVPTWRVDLEGEADLVEEVARHLGYDRIPATLAGLPDVDSDAHSVDRGERARDLLARRGFNEAYGYAMIESGEDDRFVEQGLRAPTALTHPIVETMAVLRRSILPGLLRAADVNMRRGTRDVRLFEVGRAFHPAEEGFPAEPLRAGIVWTGLARPAHWSEPARPVDWYDIAGVVEDLLDGLAPDHRATRQPGGTQAQHPGLAAHWDIEGLTVASAGALHPELQARFDEPLWLAEIDLDRLPDDAGRVASYAALPNLGAVERDIAVVLPAGRSWSEVYAALSGVPSPVPVGIEAVDRYEGKPLAPGSAAVTVRFRLQPDQTSLTEETIEAYRKSVVEELTGPLGLEIRG